MEFADILKSLRQQQRLTQEEVSGRLGISRDRYANYEQGRREPNMQMLIQISAVFDVSLDYLLGKSDDPRSADHISEETMKEVLDSELDRAIFRGYTKLTDEDKRELYRFIRFQFTDDEKYAPEDSWDEEQAALKE